MTAISSKWAALKEELERRKQADFDWEHGKVALYNYKVDAGLDMAVREAYQIYFGENALGRRAFPSVARLEDEVIDFGLDLFNCPEGGAGIFTSGGTESIIVAVKAARQWGRVNKPHIADPVIVLAETAHPSFNKAAYLLDMKVVRVPMRDDYRADVDAMGRAVGPDTVMIVGSAPSYSHGVFDDIEGIAGVAERHGLWCHVDACLGGFLAPFVKKLGYDIPAFDFRVPGVRSLSADLHKYGYAPKGASLSLYRTQADKDCAKFMFNEWPRGVYTTYTLSGTRPGGAVAGAWAALRYLGPDGYLAAAGTVMETRDALVAGVEAIPGLHVYRPFDLGVFIFGSDDDRVDINAVMACMRERGWFVGSTAKPVAIHYSVNPIHAQSIDAYLSDLASAVDEVRRTERKAAFDDDTYS